MLLPPLRASSATLLRCSRRRSSSSATSLALSPPRVLGAGAPPAILFARHQPTPPTFIARTSPVSHCTLVAQSSRRLYSSAPSAPPPPPPPSRRGTSDAGAAGTSSPSSGPTPSSSSGAPSRMPRVRTLFLLLTVSAALLTTYGLVHFLAAFRTWPTEVRVPLRRALKAQNAAEWRRAEEAFRSALSVASSLPSSTLGVDAPLKLSGISIALGSLLEAQLRPLDAYVVYASALETLQQGISASPVSPPPQWRMRAVALSQRLGDLAQLAEVKLELEGQTAKGIPLWSKGRDAAEAHLVWSVEELLRLAIPAKSSSSQQGVVSDSIEALSEPLPSSATTTTAKAEEAVQLSELHLPPWITPTDLGASLEALGALYASRHESHLAAPLFLHALSILLPPPSSSQSGSKRVPAPTAAQRCQASVLMSNLSLVYLSAAAQTTSQKAEEAARRHAREWAVKGLELTQQTSKAAGWTTQKGRDEVVQSSEERTREVRNQCIAAEITLLFNLASMAETAHDKCSAREYLQRAYRRAEQFGMREARSRCAGALSRLERGA